MVTTRLPSTSWTAATQHRTLPVVPRHRPSTLGRRAFSVAGSDGLECAAWRPPRPFAHCRQFQEDAKDASVSEYTWTLSALEALRNALYKFKTYFTPPYFYQVWRSSSSYSEVIAHFLSQHCSLVIVTFWNHNWSASYLWQGQHSWQFWTF